MNDRVRWIGITPAAFYPSNFPVWPGCCGCLLSPFDYDDNVFVAGVRPVVSAPSAGLPFALAALFNSSPLFVYLRATLDGIGGTEGRARKEGEKGHGRVPPARNDP